MKVDASKFLNSAQNLVFWKNDSMPHAEVIQKNEADAEEVSRVEPNELAGCSRPEFVPYTATVPWHTGHRNLFSRFFPRYGNYCGPNWSSGRESGSLYWDKEPVDWLDHCCYRHDMGYDSYDQMDLHKADKEFHSCLNKIPESERKNLAGTYRNIYLLGLQKFLIPYRQTLLKRVEEGKGGKETSPEAIINEVKEKNIESDRNS